MTIEKLKTAGKKRSKDWPKTRAAYLKKHPKCFICLGVIKCEVHHIKAFHAHPELELDPTNFITLCENKRGGLNCHLAFGHLGNFQSINESIHEDAAEWRVKIKTRPKWDTKTETWIYKKDV